MFTFSLTGPSQGPPTPPATPKTHSRAGKLKRETRPAPDIDFSDVDLGQLSSDVISHIEGFDVAEFEQYLPPNGHPGHPGIPGHGWSTGEEPNLQKTTHIKTEQLSPGRYGSFDLQKYSSRPATPSTAVATPTTTPGTFEPCNPRVQYNFSEQPSGYYNTPQGSVYSAFGYLSPAHRPVYTATPEWDQQPVYTQLTRP